MIVGFLGTKGKGRRGEMAKMSYRFVFLLALSAIGLMWHVIPQTWSMDRKGYENISVDQFVKIMNHKDFIF